MVVAKETYSIMERRIDMLNKEDLKDGCKIIASFIKDVAIVVGPIMVTKWLAENLSREYYNDYTYGDAVKAIMDSCMFSKDSAEAVSRLPIGMESSFYKGIIEVCESSMFSKDKRETILNMCDLKESK